MATRNRTLATPRRAWRLWLITLPLIAPTQAETRVQSSVQATAPHAPATQSFDQALAQAYRTNPRLLAARRQLQQVDETVSQALAGWRPRVTIDGSAGGALFDDNTDRVHDPERRAPQNYELRVHQPVYTSGEVRPRSTRRRRRCAPNAPICAPARRTNLVEGALSVTIPLYQGGGEYSRIRQAKEARDRYADLVDEMKRQARQLTATAWDFMDAARARVAAQKQAIAGNQVAVRGYAVQPKVGARTLLDLLITQQDLLASEVAEVSAEHDVLSAMLQVASATGLLDAPEQQLPTEPFDPVRHYDRVRDKWIGTTPPKEQQQGSALHP